MTERIGDSPRLKRILQRTDRFPGLRVAPHCQRRYSYSGSLSFREVAV
jgi:hypothetical protein